MRMRLAAAAIAIFAADFAAEAKGYRIAPYKDELFEYKQVLGSTNGGAMVIVNFDDARDVGGRDEIRLKKAYDKFVDLSVNDAKKDMSVADVPVRFMAVGKVDGGAKMVVIYLHGRHGDRSLAQEDLRFGGNFNRVKNLMLKNGGVYVTPDFSNFGRKGTAEMKALIAHYAENSPGAPIVVAGASTGAILIYQLMADPEASAMIDGVILHGPLAVPGNIRRKLFRSPVFKDPAKYIPIYIGQGSSDETVPWVTQELFLRRVKKIAPDYPIRVELFKSPDAVHGTPIRMMDWRLVLNWILENDEKIGAS